MIETSFATSPDGTRIAYDRCGAGPAIMLLHGGGVTRQEWHDTGYVGRLRNGSTVATMDLRGHGESDRPTDPTRYTTEKMIQDILAVADACEIDIAPDLDHDQTFDQIDQVLPTMLEFTEST